MILLSQEEAPIANHREHFGRLIGNLLALSGTRVEQ